MKALKFFMFLAITSLIVISCKKDINDPGTGTDPVSIDDIIVPQGFNWETTSDIEVALGVSGSKAYKAKSKVYIYTTDPADGGEMLVSGTAKPGSDFTTTMRLPSEIEEVFLKMESSTGAVITTPMTITNNMISYNFNMKSSNNFKVVTDPECNEDGDIIITQTSGTIDIEGGDTYSLSGDFTGDVDFSNSGGTLKVCGNAVFTNNVQMNKNSHHLVVTQGGTVTADDISLTNKDATIHVYSNSTLSINSNFSPKGYVSNFGLIDVDGSWENSGNDAYFDNYGTILVAGHMNLNSKTENYNACKIIVEDKFHQNSPGCTFIMGEGSYLESGDDAEFTKDETIMHEGAMIKCPRFFTNNQSQFTVTGDAVVYVTEEMDVKGDINGPLTIAYESGVDPDVSGDLTNGANTSPVDDVTLLLPVSDCNPVGFGSPEIVDTDFDGVPDEIDAYPFDELRASNSYFPSQGIWGTVGFEDLWPAKGDYDFNDLILDYTGIYVKNADNEVKDMIITFRVRAVGAAYNNAFGFQLDQINSDQVESVTGYIHDGDDMKIQLNANGTESGQSKAVIIPVETVNSIINRTVAGSMFNTLHGGGTGTYDDLEIVVTFTEAVADASVQPETFNPFLIKNQYREIEIHLPDMAPTDLADTGLFGTFQDDSNVGTGKYYKTSNDLPWAIMFYEEFDYPVEQKEITTAYLYFAAWAQSGNTSYMDWYSNTASGYRNNVNVY